MSRGDGFILYNHDALHETVQNMFNANSQITQQMQDLQSQVKQNQQMFLGSSSAQYGQSASRIAADLSDSSDRLHQVAGSVQDGSDELQQQDRKLSQLFQ